MNSKGFTLVELAIVMIIIGLLVGGILKGQELIKSAEVSRAVTELKSMQAAIEVFRSEYRAFPGDMTKASIVLNPLAGNGNGDGKLDHAEGPLAFQHLALAQLIDGNFNNEVGPSGEWVPGLTVPEGPANQSGYWFAWVDDHYDFTGNIIEYAMPIGSYVMASVLSPRDAQRIDIKIDDDNPTTGNLFALNGYEIVADGLPQRCTTSLVASSSTQPYRSAQYNLTETTKACRLMFKIPR